MYGREYRNEEHGHNCHENRDSHEGMHGMRGMRGFGLKYIILELTSDNSMTGAEITSKVEETTHGRWSPSPGIIYPALKSMYEDKYLSMDEKDNKKYYQATESGKELLKSSYFPFNRMRSRNGDIPAIIEEMESYTQYLNDNYDKIDADGKNKIKEILKSMNKFE